MAGGIYYAGKALYYQRHVSRHVGTVCQSVKSLLPDARKRLSLVVTYWQPLSCFIFLRLLLDILLNLFLHFYLLYPRNTSYTKTPYQAYVSILSASGYTCNILCAGILVLVFCISVRLIAHLSLYCYSL